MYAERYLGVQSVASVRRVLLCGGWRFLPSRATVLQQFENAGTKVTRCPRVPKMACQVIEMNRELGVWSIRGFVEP
jgi:hypothetical protein